MLGSLRKGPRCYHTISTFGVKGMAAFSVLRVCHYSCARPHTVQPNQLGAYKVCILCVTSTKVCHVNWLYIEPVYSVTR